MLLYSDTLLTYTVYQNYSTLNHQRFIYNHKRCKFTCSWISNCNNHMYVHVYACMYMYVHVYVCTCNCDYNLVNECTTLKPQGNYDF